MSAPAVARESWFVPSRAARAALVALVALLALAWGLALWRRAHNRACENAAIATLLYLSGRMEAMRADAIIDQDADGVGEYGTLAELNGLAPPRGRADLPRPAPGYLVRDILGRSALAAGGVAEKDGYRFQILLPGADGHLVADTGALLPADPAVADQQERTYVILAWPVRPWLSGMRDFRVGADTAGGVQWRPAPFSFPGVRGVPPPGPDAATWLRWRSLDSRED